MEAIQQLDLKSDEAHEKKGLSENSVYLSKNTDAGLDAPLLLEPPQNEGIIIEVETEYVDKDHELYSSEADEVDSFGCCSCFSFINFFKAMRNLRRGEIPLDSRNRGGFIWMLFILSALTSLKVNRAVLLCSINQSWRFDVYYVPDCLTKAARPKTVVCGACLTKD
ncbi:Uncharacterized protein Fot_02288 [Forsythia ovata]|uniref:Uncharacterized protein n=1 Tax=Forsythia ovata TaxID=205694 RepID=A0ABD1X6E5_9LAMI